VPAIFFAGLDLGSTMTKVVLIDQDERIVASTVRHTGAEHRRLAQEVMRETLKAAGISLEDVTYIVATGYGRINVPFADRHLTELTCHARGVYKNFPDVKIAIDIGGQDSKVLQIRHGKLLDFVMNDRCAAGTGRFLEILAAALGLKIEDLGPLSLTAKNKAAMSSPCTVFIQQEVAIHISRGVAIEDIVAGLHDVIAGKVARMAKRFKLEPDVVFTGGVAKNAGVVKALEDNLGSKILVPKEPLLSGALGAALIAKESGLKALSDGNLPPMADRKLGDATFFS
jgi:predicted CoA-substrate-specific enzyme activase